MAGVDAALLIAAAQMLSSALIGLWLRMPRIGARGEETVALDDPRSAAGADRAKRPGGGRDRISRPAEEGAFHSVMQEVQLFRKRNGAYGWSIARDLADPELWTERCRCPTWFDYLRQRNRATLSETAAERQALAFHIGPGPVRVRRMLERPFGSVRSKDYTPDDAAGPDHNGVDQAGAAIGAPARASAVPAVASPNRT